MCAYCGAALETREGQRWRVVDEDHVAVLRVIGEVRLVTVHVHALLVLPPIVLFSCGLDLAALRV
jgi:hypothetical protein